MCLDLENDWERTDQPTRSLPRTTNTGGRRRAAKLYIRHKNSQSMEHAVQKHEVGLRSKRYVWMNTRSAGKMNHKVLLLAGLKVPGKHWEPNVKHHFHAGLLIDERPDTKRALETG